MSDEYLWDRSGDPDPLVAELEDKLSGLAFEPVFLVEEAAAPTAAAAPARASSWRGYLIGSAATAAAVACSMLLFWCGYRTGLDAPTQVADQPIVVGVPESADGDADEHEPPPSVSEPAIEIDVDADEDADELEPPRVADASDVKAKAKSKTAGKGKTKSGSSRDPLESMPSTSSSSSSTKSSSSSSSAKTSDLDVDCILNPKACGKGKSSSSSSSSKPPPSGSSDPSLPEKLTTTDIRSGIAPMKDEARACGARHGAEPGEKVKIKLSISGATGAVTVATAESPHTGTPLGNCVAAALKRARFKRFQKSSLGAVYPVVM